MTGGDAAGRPAVIAGSSGSCGVIIGRAGSGYCRATGGVKLMRAGCVHEHTGLIWVCGPHRAQMKGSSLLRLVPYVCHYCLWDSDKDASHECPVMVTPASASEIAEALASEEEVRRNLRGLSAGI